MARPATGKLIRFKGANGQIVRVIMSRPDTWDNRALALDLLRDTRITPTDEQIKWFTAGASVLLGGISG